MCIPENLLEKICCRFFLKIFWNTQKMCSAIFKISKNPRTVEFFLLISAKKSYYEIVKDRKTCYFGSERTKTCYLVFLELLTSCLRKWGTRSGTLFCSNQKKKSYFCFWRGKKKLFCFQREKELFQKKKWQSRPGPLFLIWTVLLVHKF